MGPQFEWIGPGKAINLVHVVSVNFDLVYEDDDRNATKFILIDCVDGHSVKCYESYIASLRRAICDLIGGAE